jgi:hypothetical protein
MDDYLQSKTSVNSSASSAFSQQSTLINNNALVFNRGATSVDNDDFDKKRYWVHDFKSRKIIRLIVTVIYKFYKFFTSQIQK